MYHARFFRFKWNVFDAPKVIWNYYYCFVLETQIDKNLAVNNDNDFSNAKRFIEAINNIISRRTETATQRT